MFVADFRKTFKYQIFCISIQWELSCSMWMDRWRQTDMMKPIVAFCNFANVPKNPFGWVRHIELIQGNWLLQSEGPSRQGWLCFCRQTANIYRTVLFVVFYEGNLWLEFNLIWLTQQNRLFFFSPHLYRAFCLLSKFFLLPTDAQDTAF